MSLNYGKPRKPWQHLSNRPPQSYVGVSLLAIAVGQLMITRLTNRYREQAHSYRFYVHLGSVSHFCDNAARRPSFLIRCIALLRLA